MARIAMNAAHQPRIVPACAHHWRRHCLGRLPSRRPFSQRTQKRPRPAQAKFHWYPIPVGLGAAFLGLFQFYRINRREQEKRESEDAHAEPGNTPQGRPRVRPDGPWYAAMP